MKILDIIRGISTGEIKDRTIFQPDNPFHGMLIYRDNILYYNEFDSEDEVTFDDIVQMDNSGVKFYMKEFGDSNE